jgi:hypothetical protein
MKIYKLYTYCYLPMVFLVESCECALIEGMQHRDVSHLVTWPHQGYFFPILCSRLLASHIPTLVQLLYT